MYRHTIGPREAMAIAIKIDRVNRIQILDEVAYISFSGKGMNPTILPPSTEN